jgi:2-dehydropantoate 2-reductase
VIPFQNGVESIDRLGRVLGPERVMVGAAYIAARIAEPSVIVQTGSLARLRFGPVLPSQQRAAESFLAACREAGIDVELTDDILRVLWEKFVMLVAVSATTTVTRQPVGVVREDPDMRWLLESCMRETWTLGRARGISLPDDFVEESMRFANQFARETKSSMLGDLEAGGKLEVRWLSGAVARMSAEAGVDAPVNRAVFAALKPWQDGNPRR